MLDVSSQFQNLLPFQRQALIFHAINLFKGLRCTGFQEDDPKNETNTGILNLPQDWQSQNAELVSFRYERLSDENVPQKDREEFYFKFLQAAHKFEINALSSNGTNDIYSSEFDLLKDLKEEDFVNLDSWVPKQLLGQYEKDILNKLLKSSKEEERKQQNQQQNKPPQYDPFPIGGGSGSQQYQPPFRPHIIGDPTYPPPGTSGPGGNLVGPGSSIFHPSGHPYPDEIDPATGGGIPFLGGNDPNDLFPSIPGINDPRNRRNPFGGGGFGPGGFPQGPGFGGPFGGSGFGGGGFGGGGFYS
ncbi:UNKNOWN [Stylonychia lemnae]|uniref:PI31 proteasome regulator N-terminal domain-containing protein n=1 Tax=Stylonychia lemnae TaxID=5949 RepID=A0A078B9P1_STYLE|nr:UNKNOWN [Stylonychia lemnae]|eukprot:CDW89962.1 UNKNOWN [Stylonychia lemnae]